MGKCRGSSSFCEDHGKSFASQDSRPLHAKTPLVALPTKHDKPLVSVKAELLGSIAEQCSGYPDGPDGDGKLKLLLIYNVQYPQWVSHLASSCNSCPQEKKKEDGIRWGRR